MGLRSASSAMINVIVYFQKSQWVALGEKTGKGIF